MHPLSCAGGSAGHGVHFVLDPSDGVRRCPTRVHRESPDFVPTDADKHFVKSLPVDEVYISSSHSMTGVPAGAAREYTALIAPLLRACFVAPVGSEEAQLAWRMVHVVLAALLRPLGAQENGEAVVVRRMRALRAGGGLEELWRAPVVAPRARNRRHRDAARDGDVDTPEERTRRVVDARAVKLVHSGEPGRGRAALERTGELGCIQRADVTALGPMGEVAQARPGSVALEMLHKHPPEADCDRDLPACDDLLGMAPVGSAGHGLDRAALRRLTREVFADIEIFMRYVRRLTRLSMPGADAVRFEHVTPFVRHGHAADLRDFLLLIALGDVPAEARPFLYGGRLACGAAQASKPRSKQASRAVLGHIGRLGRV